MRRFVPFVFVVIALGCSVLPAPGVFRASKVRVETPAEKRQALRCAHDNMNERKNTEALECATALVNQYPAVDDYVLFLNGELSARLNQTKRARGALSTLLSKYPQSVMADRAALRLAQLLQSDGLDQRARPLFERARASSDRETRAGALTALGKIALGMGDIDGALQLFRSARADNGGTAGARAAREEIYKLRAQMPSLVPQGADAIAEVKLLLAEGDAASAEKEAHRAARAVGGEEQAQLRELLGRAQVTQGRLEEAFVSWWQVVEQAPGSSAAPEALYRIGSTLWNRDRDAAAARVFRDFVSRYPNHSRAPDCLYALGRIAQSADRSGEAIAAYGELLQRYPGSTVAYDAEWRIGWIAYERGDFAQAAERFAQLADHSRDRERDAANYWRARSNQQAGRSDRARELYGELAGRDAGYYSLLASRRLQDMPISGASFMTAEAAAIAAEDVDPGPPPSNFNAFHLERWQELRAAGLREWARGELDALAQQIEGESDELFLLRAYQATDGHARAIRMAQKRGGARLGSDEYRRIVYPLAFWPLVQSEASAAGIDPLLVVALMRQESMFDPQARSIANARGLMQLLPSTASRVSMTVDGRDVEAGTLYEPATNVHLGVRYLRNLIDRFDGNVFKALAAYNGGEAAVEKWEQRSRVSELDEFVETISFRETRDYVKRVVGNYEIYRKLYPRG